MCIEKMRLSRDLWSIPHREVLFGTAILAPLSHPSRQIPHRPRGGSKKIVVVQLKSRKNQGSPVFCCKFTQTFAKQRFGHKGGDVLW